VVNTYNTHLKIKLPLTALDVARALDGINHFGIFQIIDSARNAIGGLAIIGLMP
jgi:hypothetical protein